MEFRILGPLAVHEGSRRLDVGGPKPRALLASLLLHADDVVSADRLIDELWGETPPRTAHHLLHVYVSSVRKALGAGDRLVTRAPGYLLALGPDELDARRFERLLAAGRRLLAGGDAGGASETLAEAMALWRGPALADFPYEPFAQADIARLEELRLVALEERIEADLAVGRHLELVGELEALVAEHPLRERPRGQLMVALYRSGRQAEALDAYRAARGVLVDELGIEPGPSLKRLEQAILRHDAALEVEIVEPAPVPARASRKLVTVVVARVGSAELDALDAEARHHVVARAADAVDVVLARHGAVTERLVDEGVLGIFGVPAAREGDALRGVRAAAELRGAQVELRVGVESGEALVSGTSVSGEPVARAFRLSQAAAAGEVLLGATSYRLVRHGVLAELEPDPEATRGSGLAGRRRLLAVLPEAAPFPRRLDSVFVGREDELGFLGSAFDQAVRDRSLRLVTLVGEAGVGKSRLAQELAAHLGERAARFVGRCVPSGEGTTFGALDEIVRQAAGAATRDALLALLRDHDDREAIVAGITAALGTGEPATAREESFWAFRRLVEALAAERPLLLVLEDLHWAEPSLLELVEYLADSTRDAAVLALCLGRSELLEARPDCPETTVLAPLSRSASETLVGHLVGEAELADEARAKIVDAAEGNPLFLEQLLAMFADEERSADELTLPATIRAVLASRLDRLGPTERAVIERASVAGRSVRPDALAALLPEDAHPALDRHLQALVRKGYLRPEGSAFRFHHALIQEAAYRAVAKQARAELHERLGDFLDERGEGDEIVGHHFERAFRFREELRTVDWHARRLAVRAAERLAAAGRRALVRDDAPSAVRLLDSAASLYGEDGRRLEILPDLVEALLEIPEVSRAAAIASDTAAEAAAAGNRRVEARARIELAHVRLMSAAEGAVQQAFVEGERALAVLGALGDELGLAKAWRLLAFGNRFLGRQSARREALEHALVHARNVGNRRIEAWILDGLGGVHNYGPSSVDDLLRFAAESLRWARANGRRFSEAHSLAHGFGRSYAMLGDFGAARRAVDEARTIVEDLGFVWHRVALASGAGFVEMLAGDPAAAERELRAGYELVMRSELTGSYFGMALRDELAQAVYAQGRYSEAKALSEASERTALRDDLQAQVQWRAVRAKVLAREDRFDEAEALGRAAVALVERTEFVLVHANALMDLAEVLSLAGRPDEAVPVVEKARRLYERKGDRVEAERARATLAELGGRHRAPATTRR